MDMIDESRAVQAESKSPAVGYLQQQQPAEHEAQIEHVDVLPGGHRPDAALALPVGEQLREPYIARAYVRIVHHSASPLRRPLTSIGFPSTIGKATCTERGG